MVQLVGETVVVGLPVRGLEEPLLPDRRDEVALARPEVVVARPLRSAGDDLESGARSVTVRRAQSNDEDFRVGQAVRDCFSCSKGKALCCLGTGLGVGGGVTGGMLMSDCTFTIFSAACGTTGGVALGAVVGAIAGMALPVCLACCLACCFK